jgi:CDGSH-type Zn-finger protein
VGRSPGAGEREEGQPVADVTVTVGKNGPYLVKGPIEIMDPDGNRFRVEREAIALCRCGGSSIKPFCDGTHARIGFQSETRAVRPAEQQGR